MQIKCLGWTTANCPRYVLARGLLTSSGIKASNPYNGLPVKACDGKSHRHDKRLVRNGLLYEVTVPKVCDDELTTCVGIDMGVC